LSEPALYAEPSDNKFLIEDVPVPVAKFKTKKAKKTTKVATKHICKNCGLPVKLADNESWEHDKEPYFFGCDNANETSGIYSTVAEPGDYPIPEKVSVKKPKQFGKPKKPTEIPEGTQATCKHCGLVIRKAFPENISIVNVTGWQHQESEYKMAYDTCWYAIDGSGVSEKLNKFQKPTNSNKSYISVEQAEPTEEWLAEYVKNYVGSVKPVLKPLLILGEPLSLPMITTFKGSLNSAGVPEVVESCMYCDQPVRLSYSSLCPNDWTHYTTDYRCAVGATLDGQLHVADTFNTPNEFSREEDRDQRTAFFEFLKNTYQKKAVFLPAHDGTFPIGRKFRYDKVEKD
jgi:hypothetical protein